MRGHYRQATNWENVPLAAADFRHCTEGLHDWRFDQNIRE